MRVREIEFRRQIASETLCAKCTHAHIVQFEGSQNFKVICKCDRPFEVKKRVTNCTDFTEPGTMTKHYMERIAWVIEKKGKKGEIGFAAPSERRKDSASRHYSDDVIGEPKLEELLEE